MARIYKNIWNCNSDSEAIKIHDYRLYIKDRNSRRVTSLSPCYSLVTIFEREGRLFANAGKLGEQGTTRMQCTLANKHYNLTY